MLPKDALKMRMLVVPPVELVKKFTALAEAAPTRRLNRPIIATLLPKLLGGKLSAAGLGSKLEIPS